MKTRKLVSPLSVKVDDPVFHNRYKQGVYCPLKKGKFIRARVAFSDGVRFVNWSNLYEATLMEKIVYRVVVVKTKLSRVINYKNYQ